MTADQLDALRRLIRMRGGPATVAAKLVLVDGWRQADAAREAGCTPSQLGDALRRLRAARELAMVAVGVRSEAAPVRGCRDDLGALI